MGRKQVLASYPHMLVNIFTPTILQSGHEPRAGLFLPPLFASALFLKRRRRARFRDYCSPASRGSDAVVVGLSADDSGLLTAAAVR